MPFIDFAAVKSAVSVPTLLDAMGWRWVSRSGDARRGPCPVHGSTFVRSRTFVAHNRWWWCWKCRRGGDVLDLAAAVNRGGDLAALAKWVCDVTGVDAPVRMGRRSRGRAAGPEERPR